MRGLGITASHQRKIKSGAQFDKYFGAPKGLDPIVNKDASTLETVDIIAGLVPKVAYQTKSLAPVLKGSSLKQTCKNIFDFCYNHIQYKLDASGVEQLREPVRAWKDRVSGIDCDCFSILVSSILHNLGIKHSYRICEIANKGYYQHIYIVVPVNQTLNSISGQYIVIDPVLDTFNKEAPGITKIRDKFMGIPVQVLNGIEDYSIMGFGAIGAADSLEGVQRAFKTSVVSHLRNTKNKIANSPKCLAGMYDPSALMGVLDRAEQLLEDGSDQALAALYNLDEPLLGNPFAGLGDAELGDLGKPKFLKKIATAAKSVKNAVKEGTSNIQDAAKKSAEAAKVATKKAVDKAKEVAKKGAQVVVKYNPVSTAARAGVLLAMKTNLFGLAEQLKWGYATPEQISKFGISSADYQKAKTALAKAKRLFVDTLKGQESNLKDAILSGKNKLEGLSGLGEPVTAATTAAAATPFLLQIKEFIKGLNIKVDLKKIVGEGVKKGANNLIDKSKNLLTPKPKTTIENNTLVVDPNQNSDSGNNNPDSIILDEPSSQDMIVDNVNNNSTPEGETTEKSSNKGLIVLGILGLVGVGLAATSGKKSKSLSGPGKSRKPKSKYKTKKSKNTIVIK